MEYKTDKAIIIDLTNDKDDVITNNTEKELDSRCYEIRSQMFQIGFLDERYGAERTSEDVQKIVEKICSKYGWLNTSDEYKWIYGHYYDGLRYYKEAEQLYYNKQSEFNPKSDFCYHYLLERENLDPDIRDILTSYLDFEYEMKCYYKQKEKQD